MFAEFTEASLLSESGSCRRVRMLKPGVPRFPIFKTTCSMSYTPAEVSNETTLPDCFSSSPISHVFALPVLLEVSESMRQRYETQT